MGRETARNEVRSQDRVIDDDDDDDGRRNERLPLTCSPLTTRVIKKAGKDTSMRTKRRTTRKTLRLEDKKGRNEFCRDKTIQVRDWMEESGVDVKKEGETTENLQFFVAVERDGVQEE